MYEDFIPARLARLRTQMGVSARDMSLSLGQSESYINKIENRKSLPSMNGFFYICEYLGVQPRDFFDEDYRCPGAGNELFEEIKKLDEEQIGHILALMRLPRSIK